MYDIIIIIVNVIVIVIVIVMVIVINTFLLADNLANLIAQLHANDSGNFYF